MNVYNVKIPGVTYLDYFDFEGKRYTIGTTIKIKDSYKSVFPELYDKKTIVLQHTIEAGKEFYYIFKKYNNGEIRWYTVRKSPDEWIDSIIQVGDPNIDPCERPVEYEKDSENGEVKFGWLIYILVMFGLLLFKDWWLGWIAVSIYFFNWRKKKLRK